MAQIGVIESPEHKPVPSLGGEDAYLTFFTKVAAIGYTLAHDHGFSDGNKRTAVQVMLNTLERNNFYPDSSEREKVTAAILAAMNLADAPSLRVPAAPPSGVRLDKVEWKSAFYRGYMNNDPPPELNDEAAEKAVKGLYRTGLDALKAKVEKGS